MARKSKKNKQTARPTSPAPPRAPASPLLWIARICFAGAAAVAMWLLFYALTEKPMAGCGPGSACDRVMGSAWAYWLEIPVSAPALAVYLTLLVCSIVVTSRRSNRVERAWAIGFVCSILLLFVASWFIYLQLHVIKSLCKFCATAHALSVIGAVLFLSKAPQPATTSRARKLAFVALALVPFAALIAGQELAPHKTNTVTLYRGALKFDLRDAPMIGSPEAKSFIVELFDYTCPDCHDMHAKLATARERMTNAFSIILVPCPLDANCNSHVRNTQPKHKNACEYARLGLALRRCGAKLFQQYDEWFFSRGSIPTLEAAREQAAALAGKESLEKALADPWVATTVQRGIFIYNENGRESKNYRIPEIIVGDTINFGPVRTVDELVRLLQEHLPAAESHS
jgi:uncharacterized membrane protein